MRDAASQEEQFPTTTCSWAWARANMPLAGEEGEGAVCASSSSWPLSTSDGAKGKTTNKAPYQSLETAAETKLGAR